MVLRKGYMMERLLYGCVIGAIWLSLACFVGAIRLQFWPLILQSITFMAITMGLIIMSSRYDRIWFFPLVILSVVAFSSWYIYEFRLKGSVKLLDRGITYQQLLLFKGSTKKG